MKDLSPSLDPVELAVLRLPAGWQPPAVPGDRFTAVVSSDLEVTVVCDAALLSEDAWSQQALDTDLGWQRITFPGPLPWEQVGFLADVASRLAGAQIPFTSISGFTTDHVLVRAAQANLAMAVLSGEQPPPQRPGTNP
ncbi:MAG TPA: ACT domain-containing protein [Mycobacteriales bacterium]|nr:ACT domain-containing protein [Mycobacteriales bacterium]